MTRYESYCPIEHLEIYNLFLLALAAEGVERFPINGKKLYTAFAETLREYGIDPQIDVISGIPKSLDYMIIEGMEALLLQTDNSHGYLIPKPEAAARELSNIAKNSEQFLHMARHFKQRITTKSHS